MGGISYLDSAKIVPGGSGNVAVGMSLLGLKTAFIGKAGKDYLGKLYSDDLVHQKILTKIFYDKNSPTGIVIVFTEHEGERSFQVFRGANDGLTAEEVESSKMLIKNSKYLYICGCSLINSKQQSALLKAIEIAKSHDVKVIFDAGAYNIIEPRRDLFQRVLSSCDIFCPNEKEALAITETKTLKEAIRCLREKGILTAIKRGKKGSIFVNRRKTIRTLPFKVEAVDSTGAGDAFIAAITYGLVKRMPLDISANFANWYAAQIVKSCGARNFPSRKAVQSFLAGQRSKDLKAQCAL
jgi:sugar/nucleoside kinase (ribokinase family)